MEPACIIANITPEPSNTLPTEEEFQLLKATGHNDVTTFTQILKENLDKIDINSLYNGHTLLTHAVVRNRYSICEALLNFAQCDINAPNSQGETPLILAVVKGNENIARLLLESGCDVHKSQFGGNAGTALYNAVWKGEARMVEMLIQSGCDLDKGSNRFHPLFMAARLGCVDIAKLLINAGCEKNVMNDFGVTPLYEAVLRGHSRMIEMLLEEGCEVNTPDMYGVSPLCIAARWGTLNIINILLKARADPCQKTRQGDTAADIVMPFDRYDRPAILEELVLRGAEINRLVHRREALWCVLCEGPVEKRTAEVLIRAHPMHAVGNSQKLQQVLSLHSHLPILMILSGFCNLPRLDPTTIQKTAHREFFTDYYNQPNSLQSCTRIAIRRHLGIRCMFAIKHLPLPNKLIDFLLLRHRTGVSMPHE